MIRFFTIALTSLLLLHGAMGGEVFKAHDRFVLSLAVSLDGKWLASGSDDDTLKLWEFGTRKLVASRKFGSAVTALTFHKSGKELVVGTWDGELHVVDPKTLKTLRQLKEHKETITVVTFDSSGNYLASGSADDRLIVWDIKTSEDLLTFEQGNEYDVTTAAFNVDASRIVTGDGDNNIVMWDAESGEEIGNIEGHTAVVSAVSFSPNGKHLATASWDKTIRIWNAESGEPIKTLTGHTAEITRMSYTKDGDFLVSTGDDKTLRIWDVQEGKPIEVRKLKLETISSMTLAGGKVVLGSKDVIAIEEIPK